jgi:hypothetical protein
MAAPVAAMAVESAPATPFVFAEPAPPGEEADPWEEPTASEDAEHTAAEAPTIGEVHPKRSRSRVFTATVVLACVVLVVLGAVAVTRSLHRHTTPTTAAGPPAHPTVTVPPSSDATRIEAATDALDSATTSASVGLSSLASFPTPTNVERVINPYISSLQLYGTLLSGSTVPTPARSAASSAEAQVHQDLTFLDTIDALPSVQLGAFLRQFDADATQLQTTLNSLEQNLKMPRS